MMFPTAVLWGKSSHTHTHKDSQMYRASKWNHSHSASCARDVRARPPLRAAAHFLMPNWNKREKKERNQVKIKKQKLVIKCKSHCLIYCQNHSSLCWSSKIWSWVFQCLVWKHKYFSEKKKNASKMQFHGDFHAYLHYRCGEYWTKYEVKKVEQQTNWMEAKHKRLKWYVIWCIKGRSFK